MKMLDAFSGIGGFSLAASTLDIQTTQFVEINSYCQQVLSIRFPGAPICNDIRTFTANVGDFDIICGGFPCQDISSAGKQEGIKEGTRSGLFFELCRVIRMVRPKGLVLENVAALLANGMDIVLRELSQMGYSAEWGVLSAAEMGAVHKRDRVWIIAYPESARRFTSGNKYAQERLDTSLIRSGDDAHADESRLATGNSKPQSQIAQFERRSGIACNPNTTQLKQRLGQGNQRGKESLQRCGMQSGAIAQSQFCGGDDGIPSELDGYLLRHAGLEDWLTAATVPSFSRLSSAEIRSLTAEDQAEYRQLYRQYQEIRYQHRERLAALGNAIVPQCAVPIFRLLLERLGGAS